MAIRIFIFTLITSISIEVFANPWTGHKQVLKLYPHGPSKGIFVSLEGSSINPGNCPQTDWYFLGPDNHMQKEIFSLLLAAKKSRSPVSMYIDTTNTCPEGRPSILAVVEDTF